MNLSTRLVHHRIRGEALRSTTATCMMEPISNLRVNVFTSLLGSRGVPDMPISMLPASWGLPREPRKFPRIGTEMPVAWSPAEYLSRVWLGTGHAADSMAVTLR